PEDGRRDPRRPPAVRRFTEGSDARGHGLRAFHDARAVRGRPRHPAREAHAACVRAGGGRGVPDRQTALRGHRRGGRASDGEERGRVMANAKEDVKRLREETGAGVMDCKRALDEAVGAKAKYHRVLLKLSGEALLGERAFGISPKYTRYLAEEIKKVHDLGTEVAVVVGGGNIMRGAAVAEHGIEEATAHYMGMLAM